MNGITFAQLNPFTYPAFSVYSGLWKAHFTSTTFSKFEKLFVYAECNACEKHGNLYGITRCFAIHVKYLECPSTATPLVQEQRAFVRCVNKTFIILSEKMSKSMRQQAERNPYSYHMSLFCSNGQFEFNFFSTFEFPSFTHLTTFRFGCYACLPMFLTIQTTTITKVCRI